MKSKNPLLVFALLACCSLSALAQVDRIEGDVVKAGTKEPVVGADVVIERTDIKGSYPVKTDKKGHYLHAGVPFVGTYAVMISAPGHEPAFQSGIRPGRGPINFELREGDGRKLTMEDIKKASGGAAAGGGAGAAAQKQMSDAEAKKAQAEYEKKRAEVESANKKNAADFENMKKFFESGIAKSNSKDYAGAISDFTEANRLDADQYSIWANLALALYNRGVTYYNESTKDPSKRDPAKQDFSDSVKASEKALALVEPKLADPAQGAQMKKSKAQFLKIKADAEGLLAKKMGVAEMTDASVKDYRAAAELNELPADKAKLQLAAAEVYFDSGKSDEAVAAYNEILTASPDNLDAIYKLALSYAAAAKFQESANTFQKFLDKAPENDARVPEVKAVMKDLVVGNNLQPPKSEPTKKAPAKRKP